MPTTAPTSDSWTILLYYKYVPIKDPKKFAHEHLNLCKSLNLKGRILVAEEGINGTVGGSKEATDKYRETMHNDPLFSDIVFKTSIGPSSSFKKIFVRPRAELVTLNIKEKIDPNKDGGTYLQPEKLKKMYDNEEDFVIIDMRNDYEATIGKFKNAVTLPMQNFKQLPRIVRKKLMKYKDKKVVTYCTGGIRCEKASALLKKNGFINVYQLEGGIHNFGQQFPDDYWEGKLFVFDERMAVPINTAQKRKIIANCLHCGKPWDDYINCINAKCNKLIILCNACREAWNDACSKECSKNPRKIKQPA